MFLFKTSVNRIKTAYNGYKADQPTIKAQPIYT